MYLSADVRGVKYDCLTGLFKAEHRLVRALEKMWMRRLILQKEPATYITPASSVFSSFLLIRVFYSHPFLLVFVVGATRGQSLS